VGDEFHDHSAVDGDGVVEAFVAYHELLHGQFGAVVDPAASDGRFQVDV